MDQGLLIGIKENIHGLISRARAGAVSPWKPNRLESCTIGGRTREASFRSGSCWKTVSRGPFQPDPPLFQDHTTPAIFGGHPEVVGDDQDGVALSVQTMQHLQQSALMPVVQAGGGLVQDQQPRGGRPAWRLRPDAVVPPWSGQRAPFFHILPNRRPPGLP